MRSHNRMIGFGFSNELNGVFLMPRQQKMLFLFGLCICSSVTLTACSQVLHAVPRPIQNSFINMVSNIDKDELVDDTEFYAPTDWDFDRLTKKVLANPQNATILRNRGRAYYWGQKYELALADYDKALSMVTTKAKWYDERAKVFVYLDKFAEALRDSDTAIKLEDSDASFFTTRAEAYDGLGKCEDVCKAYAQATKLDPSCGYDWGKALVKCGRDNDAVTVFNQVITEHENFNASDELISIYIRQGKFDLARKSADAWKTASPDRPEPFLCSAKIFEAFGEHAEAQSDYRHLIEIFDEENANRYTWSDRADYFDKLKQPEKAKEARRRSLAEWEKDYGDDLESMAKLHEQIGEPDKAKELRARDLAKSQTVVEKSPNDADGYHSRAVSYEQLGKYQDALADFQHARELDPSDAHLVGHQADTLNSLGRYSESLVECKAFLKKKPDDGDTLLFSSMAKASEKLGKHADTIECCNAWLKNTKDDGNAYHWRAQAYRELGKKELAKRDEILSKWFVCEDNEEDSSS